MTNTLFAVPAALLWGSVVWQFPSRTRGTTQRALWLALLALAVTATLQVPAIERMVDSLTPGEPNLAYLVKHVLVVGVAAAAREVLREVTLSAEQARRGRGRRLAVTSAAVVALTVLFLLAPVERDVLEAEFTTRYGLDPAMLMFWGVFLAWLAAALVSTMHLTWRYGRRTPASRLRTAILVIGGSAAVCLGYVAAKVAYLVALFAGVGQRFTGSYAALTRTLLLVSMVLLAVGCAWPRLARVPLFRRVMTYRRLRRLEPLWQALYEATPGIALAPPKGGRVALSPTRDLEMRLYRRVIEIRDGALALRPYAPPGTRGRARTAASVHGVPEAAVEAVAEAVWLEVARRAKLRGDISTREPSSDAGGGADLAGEVEILERVSRAYRRSDLVALLADRLERRDERRAEGVT